MDMNNDLMMIIFEGDHTVQCTSAAAQSNNKQTVLDLATIPLVMLQTCSIRLEQS